MTRIRTGVAVATTQNTNHYTITASYDSGKHLGISSHTRRTIHVWLQVAMMLALCDIVFKVGLLNRKIKANTLSKQLLQGSLSFTCFYTRQSVFWNEWMNGTWTEQSEVTGACSYVSFTAPAFLRSRRIQSTCYFVNYENASWESVHLMHYDLFHITPFAI